MTSEKSVGDLGEGLAAEYLLQKGYKIIARNFKKRYGELDLVCWQNDGRDEVLVVVEVKTRTPGELVPPEEAVTKSKIWQLKKTLEFFVLKFPQKLPELARIDVIAIDLDKDLNLKALRHIENVTI